MDRRRGTWAALAVVLVAITTTVVPGPGASPAGADPVPVDLGACTHTWNGLIGDGRWQSAGNWSPDDVPGAGAVACVGGNDVTVDGGATQTVAGVTVTTGGSLTIPSGARLDVEGAAEIVDLRVTGGTFGGAGDVVVTGGPPPEKGSDPPPSTFTWTTGHLTGTGALVVGAGGSATLGDGQKELSRPLVNDDSMDWTGGRIIVHAGGGITNDGFLTISAVGQIDDGFGPHEPALVNNAQITVTSAGRAVLHGVALDSIGDVAVEAGATLELGASDTTGSEISGTVSGDGALDVTGGSVTTTGFVDLPSVRVAGSASLTIDEAEPLTPAAIDTLTLDGGSTLIDRSAEEVLLGTLTHIQGTLGGATNLEPATAWEWRSGRLEGTGRIRVGPGVDAEIGTGGQKVLARQILNDDALTWSGTGRLILEPGGAITNDGVLTVTASQVDDGFVTGHEPVLTNNALLKVETAGTFLVHGVDVASIGDVEVTSGTTLQLDGDPDRLISGSLTGAGTVQVGGGTLDLIGEVGIEGLTAKGGTTTVAARPPQVDAEDGEVAAFGRLTIDGGTVQIDRASNRVGIGRLTHVQGTLTGSADLRPTTAWSWTSGTVSGTGRIGVGTDVTATWGPGGQRTIARRVDVDGTANNDGGRVIVAPGGSLHVNGRLTVTGTSQIDDGFVTGHDPVLTSSGTLTIDAAASLAVHGLDVESTGQIDLRTGALLDIADDLALGTGATVSTRVAGADPTQHGRIAVDGTATLDGTLSVTTVAPFTAGSAAITVVDAATREGTFATFDGAGWTLTYSGGDVVIGPESATPPTVVVLPTTVAESADAALVTVQGVGGTVPITLPVSVIAQTAGLPADVTAPAPTVTVPPNGSTVVSVPLVDDSLDEADETFLLDVGGSSAAVTITDDDATPIVRIDDAGVDEGDDGTHDLAFTVRLTDALGDPTPSGRNVAVFVSTSDGSATDGDDYTGISTLVAIPAGQTSVTVDVPISGDTVPEADETFVLTLASPTAADLDPEDRTATGTITDDDGGTETEAVAEELRAGAPRIASALPGWGSGFDLGIDLPVVTDDLSTALGIEPAVAGAGDDALAPFAEVDGALADVVADLEAAGITIDWATGGVGGTPTPPTADDILQARYQVTLADLAEAAGFDGDHLEPGDRALQDLAAALDLDAELDLSGDLVVTIVFGVDVDGFYVSGESSLALTVTADGTITGTADAGGVDGLSVDGTGEAEATVVLRPTADRLRADDLATAAIEPSATATGDLELDLTIDQLALTWTAAATLATDGDEVDVERSASVAGTLDLPGFRLGSSPDATPARITFIGESTDDGWALDGTATVASDLEADGFVVRSLTGTALMGPETSDVEAELALAIADTEVAATLSIDDEGWEGSATVERESLDVGPVHIDDPSITVTATHVVDTGATTVAASVTAGGGRVDGPGGPEGEPIVEVTGLDGSIDDDGRVCVEAETVEGTIGEGLAFETDVAAADVEVCSPGGDGVLVRVGEVTATLAELDGLEVTITGLVLDEELRFGAESVAVEQPDGIARAIGLAGLVPVDLTSLELTFPDHVPGSPVPDLSRFELALVGTIDLSDDAFAGLPFTPVVQIGGDVITPDSPPAEREIRFSAEVDGTDPLVVRPLDLGPITLGFEDLELGDYTLAGSITAEGYVDGVLQPNVCGSAEVTGGFDTFTAGAAAEVCGSISETDDGPVVDLDATISGSLAVRDGVEIEDLALTFAVTTRFVDGAVEIDGSLESSSLGRVTIPFGEYATLQATDASLDLSPAAGEPALRVGGSLDVAGSGASLVFGPALDVLGGWGGRVGQVGLTEDFVPIALDGFFAQVDVPPGERFGLPDFLPLFVDDIGFSLPEETEDGDIEPGTELSAEVLEGLRVRFSGGLAGTPTFPITASVQGLEVDIGRLLAFDPLAPIDLDTFPITNLDGVSFGIEPALDLGGVAVSGSLSFGAIDVGDTSVLYGRIRGDVSTPAFEAGADIVISEAGPVLLRVTAPVGVPLGPTGFVLRSVTGAASFGPEAVVETPRDGHPEDLMTELFDLPTDVEVDEDTIAAAVGPTVPPAGGTPTYTWDHGFAIALEGNLSHIASAGMVEGRVTLAAAFGGGDGVKLVGRGAISAFGIPLSEGIEVGGDLAVGGIMFDFTEPLEPGIDLAFESPVDGSPLAVVFPAQAQVSAQLRTDGVVEGIGAGLEAFVTAAVDGGLEVGADLFAAALDDLAADLQARRSSPLARAILPPGDPTPITADLLQARLATLLGDPATAGPVVGPLLGGLATSIADGVASGDFGTTLSEAASALYDVIGDAAVAALRAAGERFDPSFTFTGALQPLVLGIPLGDPTTSVTVAVDRTSLRFEATISMIETLKAAAGQLPGVGVFAREAINLATLGGRDTLTFGVQVPLPGLTDVLLLGGDLPELDPADAAQGWSITAGGAYELHGLRAEVSGFLTGPGNEAFVDAKVERRWESDGTTPPDPDRIQITRPEDYDNLLAYGGLVLDGRLEVPRLLTDPVDVLGDLPPIPEEPEEIIGWLADGADVIGQTETPVRLTAFLPGMDAVIADPTEATVEAWADAAVVSGVLEGTRANPGDPPVAKLLSIPIGEGTLLADRDGVHVEAEIPLLGARGTFDLKVEDRDGVPVPAGGLALDLSAADALAALRDLGLPTPFTLDATAHVRAFTPGFDPTSDDLLERKGGLAVGATLDADGFVEDAAFDVAIDPIGTGFGPDFTATASVDRIGPFGGNEVGDATIDIRKLGKDVTVHVSGSATLGGTEVQVTGDLAPDLTGTLTVTTGPTPTIGGLRFTQGGFSLTLARVGGELIGSIGISGTVELPAFMAARSSTATATAAGCLGTDGAVEIRLGLSGLKLDPSGATSITGTGAALPIDPDAPCTLPPGTPPLPTSSARFVLRTVDGVTTVVVDGAVRVSGSDLPLLTVVGSLATDGTGSLAVRFGTDGLDLSGFEVRGGATLRLLAGGAFDLAVDGRVSVPGVVDDASVSGQITSAGIQRLSVAVTGLDLSPVTFRSGTLDIVRVGSGYRLDAALTVDVTGVRRTSTSSSPSITIRGSIASTGDFSLRADGNGFTVAGVGLTSASLSIVKTGSTFTVAAGARFALWGTSLEVEGSLTISTAGVSGRFRLSLPNNPDGTEPALKVGGWGLGGTFELAFTISGGATRARVSLTNGTLAIPGVGNVTASADMATDGTGSITVSAGDGIRLGGSTSPFLAFGTFSVKLVGGVATFTATGAHVRFQPPNQTEAFRVAAPDLRISSDGSFAFATQGATIGQADGLKLVIPSARLEADPLGLDLTFVMGAGSLHIPELADGSAGRPVLTTQPITVRTGPFRYTLFEARTLDLGLLRLNGKLVLERTSAGVFRLAIEGTSAGPAHIDLGTLGRVDLPSFSIASNGDFSVTATTRRLGAGGVEILDAGFTFQRAANLVFLGVTGGKLRLPSLSQPIELPSMLIRGDTSFTRRLTLPRIDLGPAFRTGRDADFILRVTRTEISFELEDKADNDPTVVALAGSTSMTLNAFRVTSGGVFTGSVTGRLALFGHRIASATFNVRLAGGVLELSLPASADKTLNLGFATMSISGFARSDGTFSMTGSASTDGSLLGVTWDGSVSITVSSSSGITGSYRGRVSVGAISATADGSMSSTGHVEGSVGLDLNGDGSRGGFTVCGPLGCTRIAETVSYEFDMDPTPLSEDTTAPTMAQPANLSITTSQATGTIPVFYTQPTASDSRDGTLVARCTPGSGADFTIGRSTTVTCTARDAAGNSRTRTFTITVTFAAGVVSLFGGLVSADLAGFSGGSASSAFVFSGSAPIQLSRSAMSRASEPRHLADETADAGGIVRYRIEMPTDLTPGPGHIVAAGVDPSGAERLWVVPITVGPDGRILSLTADAAPPIVVPPPSSGPPSGAPGGPILGSGSGSGSGSGTGGLARTGAELVPLVRLALLLGLLGLVLVATSHRRYRRAR